MGVCVVNSQSIMPLDSFSYQKIMGYLFLLIGIVHFKYEFVQAVI